MTVDPSRDRPFHYAFHGIEIDVSSDHAELALFVHRKLLPKNALELPRPHAECLLDTEQLRELLQQVGGFALGEIEARVDGPQFDLAMGALGIDERLESMRAKDRAQRTCLRRLASQRALIQRWWKL